MHEEKPVQFENWSISYEPGESLEQVKGGNSNWRGPIWLPTNYLFLESLKRLQEAVGSARPISTADGVKPISQVIDELRSSLLNLFCLDRETKRALHGDASIYATDPLWRDLVLFYEHYHGDTGRGLGASHQTGWSGLAALLLQNK